MNTPLCSRWTLANPWLWLGPGTGLAMTVATIARGGMEPGPGLVALAVVGLLTTGIGLAVRLNSDHSPFAPRWMHFLLIVALILFLAGSSALQSWIFAAALWGVDPFQSDGLAIGHPPPFYPGLMGIVWALIVPMSVYALMKLVRHGFKAGGFSKETETAALLLFTTANCLLVGYALGADTLRLFLSVTAFLASALTAFVLLPQVGQRLVFSAAVTLHFAAIFTATMAQPPYPWWANQSWSRLARPYLEFMYLNNAYHFYSPDPGPASFLWFRLYYDTGVLEKDDAGNEVPKFDAVWYKIPNVDANGQHDYRVALEYQRYLSITENVVPHEQHALWTYDETGMPRPAPFYERRLANSPARKSVERIGQPQPIELIVPFHPGLPHERQYARPTLSSLRLLESYVRHVARRPHPEHPDWPIVFVRAYRVIHVIPPPPPSPDFELNKDPLHAEYFLPLYMGLFHPDGRRVLDDEKEPLLYWLLPMIPISPEKDVPVESFAARHANDKNCIYLPAERKWVDRVP